MTYQFADWQSGARPAKGFDVADCVENGWSRDDIAAMMKAAVCDVLPDFPAAPEPVPAQEVAGIDPGGFPDAAPSEPLTPAVEADPLKRMRGTWCFVAGRALFRDIHTGAEVRMGAFDLMYQRHIPMMDHMPNGDVLAKPREVPPSDWLVAYGFGQVVHDTMYLPSNDGVVIEQDGVEYLNSYLPRYVPAAASSYEGHWAVDVWQRHLEMILPDDWKLLLTWLAYNAQNPGKKVLWAPIVKGTQGDGKTTISKMLGAVMGSRNVKVVSTESLFSDFTGYAEGACVAFLEEIRVKGHNRHDAMNKLKPLVTNEVIEVVRKGQDGRNVPNVTNYMAFTNFEDALVIDANDRRWGVFFTRFPDREALAAAGVDAEYWNKLHGAVEQHADVLRAWLLDVDTSEFDPKAAPPITAAKAAMIASSISAEAAMLQEVVSLGRLGVGHHVAATDAVNVALKSEHGQVLATTRMATAFAEISWTQYGQIKWQGRARRVYIDSKHAWPAGDAQMRAEVRRLLDETEGGAMVSPLDDVMAVEPVREGW